MAIAHFSRKAEEDLLNIAAYTLQKWGEAQADRYLAQIEACCFRLAGNPRLGRLCGDLHADWHASGLRRMERGKHVVFYREHDDGILVSRILHVSMLPDKYTMEDDA